MIASDRRLFDGKLTVTRIVLAYFLAKILQGISLNYFSDYRIVDIVSGLMLLVVFYFLVRVFIFPSNPPLKTIIKHEFDNGDAKLNATIFILVLVVSIFFRYGVLILIVFYNSVFEPETVQNSIDSLRLMAVSEVNVVFNLQQLTSITIGPVVEEFVYRGFILGCLLARYKVNTAVIFSAIIFGAFHGGGFFSAFLGGVFFAAIYIFFRNLFLCIAAHSLVNLFVALSPSLIVKITPFSFSEIIEYPLLGLSIIPGILVIVAFVFFISYYWNKREFSPFPAKMIKQVKND